MKNFLTKEYVNKILVELASVRAENKLLSYQMQGKFKNRSRRKIREFRVNAFNKELGLVSREYSIDRNFRKGDDKPLKRKSKFDILLKD